MGGFRARAEIWFEEERARRDEFKLTGMREIMRMNTAPANAENIKPLSGMSHPSGIFVAVERKQRDENCHRL